MCHEDGTSTTLAALSAPIGSVIRVRVRYRCRACTRPPVAEVLHYQTEDGTEVVCFVGKAYEEDGSGNLRGYTRNALLTPDRGTPPECECPEHGGLVVTAEQVRAHVSRSIAVELREARNADEKVTRTIRLPPRAVS